MRFSIVIPQLFYDLIARILPGFFFIIVFFIGMPELMEDILVLELNGGHNFIDSLGKGIGFAGLCYFLGWLFHTFTCFSKREVTKEKHQQEGGPQSLYDKYQWIRLSHPPAGFRIIKLRAEARMLETSRTAMFVVIVLTILYVDYLLLSSIALPNKNLSEINCIRLVSGLILALVSFIGFRKCEEKAWDQYWANIVRIYRLLHDNENPVIGIQMGDNNP